MTSNRTKLALALKQYTVVFTPENKAILHILRGTQRQFSENICSEDDLRSRIFGIFVVKFLACLPLLGFSNI